MKHESKPRPRQVCTSNRIEFAFRMSSKSNPGEEHIVRGWFLDGHVECDCKGFEYRGTCRHTNLVNNKCGWSELGSPVPQTMEQKEAHECPVCGGKTITVMTGDL